MKTMTRNITLVGLVVTAAALGLAACEPAPPADPMAKEIAAARAAPPEPVAPGLQKAVTGVESVRVADNALMVGLTIKSAWNEQQLIDFTSLKVEKIGEAIQAGAEPLAEGVKEVDVMVEVPLTDRLGNETPGHLMTLTFDAADMRAAKFDNLTIERTLNLAKEVRTSAAGRSAVAAWCAEAAHDDGQEFCSRAL